MAIIKFDSEKADALIRDLNRISSDIESNLGKVYNNSHGKEISLNDKTGDIGINKLDDGSFFATIVYNYAKMEFYTTYENINYCKPNPAYFKEVASRLGIEPSECLMVGNDAVDDIAAEKAGMKVFLLTDCLINKENVDIAIQEFEEFCKRREEEKYISNCFEIDVHI